MPPHGIPPRSDGSCECGCGRAVADLIAEGIRHVPLTRRAVAIIDAEDWAVIRISKWHLTAAGYAASRRARKSLLMHRFLIGAGKGEEVDHINRNKVDNRRANLRIVPHAVNSQNKTFNGLGRPGKRNVYWRADRQRYRVILWPDSGAICGGHYRTLEEAVDAARRLRTEHYPEATD